MEADTMEVDEPIEGGEVTSVIETGDMRGNSASAAINPPEPMEMAANGDNALSLGGINKFSQAADRRGQSLQDIERTISPARLPQQSRGMQMLCRCRAGAANSPGCFASCCRKLFAGCLVMERLRRMLVVGGEEGPERSYWPACCGKVTIAPSGSC